MRTFTETTPSLEDFWRSIILLGRNVASYKFALGKSLLELAHQDQEEVPLDELAVPFARHLCEHLKLSDQQGTSAQSRLLDACRAFNRGVLRFSQEVRRPVSAAGPSVSGLALSLAGFGFREALLQDGLAYLGCCPCAAPADPPGWSCAVPGAPS